MIGVKLAVRAMRKEYADPLTPELSITKGSLRHGLVLSRLAETYDNRAVITLIIFLINDYCAQFNVNKNMSPAQVSNLAEELFMDEMEKPRYSQMTIDELALFFDRAKKNEYGEPFDRIDAGFIRKLLDKYYETDRTAAVHSILEDKDNEFKRKEELLPRTNTPMAMSELVKKEQDNRPYDIKGLTDKTIPNAGKKENS